LLLTDYIGNSRKIFIDRQFLPESGGGGKFLAFAQPAGVYGASAGRMDEDFLREKPVSLPSRTVPRGKFSGGLSRSDGILPK
jgi:hypothetical protein